jgi:hypothetical protein
MGARCSVLSTASAKDVGSRTGPRAAGAIVVALGCFAMATSAADSRPAANNGDLPDERGIDVQEQACGKLDVARLRSLFALEVRTVIHRLGPVAIVVTCEDNETRLRAESPTWGIAERSVPGALGAAEAERLLALAGAQLVFAVWLDAQPDRANHRVDATTHEAPRSVAAPAPPAAVQSAPQRQSSFDVGVEAGARARVLGALALGPSAGLLATAWLRSWGAELSLSVDRTTVARPLGTAELVAGELGLGAAWRSNLEGPLALEVSAGPALAALDLRGVSPASHVTASSLAGLTLDARAAATVRYRKGGLWALARFEGGYLVSGPEGTITGDSSITTRGAWTGASLGAGGAW